MKVLGIIVHHGNTQKTLESARSLAAALQNTPSGRFVVVGDRPNDLSLERFRNELAREPWSGLCEVLEASERPGFAAANNHVLRRNLQSRTPAEYFYLLSPEAQASPDALDQLVEFMDNHRYAAIGGSLVRTSSGTPVATTYRFPSLLSDLEQQAHAAPVSKLLRDFAVSLPTPAGSKQVDWLATTSVILRASVLQKIGLFDDGFLGYFEITDLCRRAASAGFPCYFVHESEVRLLDDASNGVSSGAWFQARAHYLRKHHGERFLLGANLAWLTGRLLRGVRSDNPALRLRDFVTNSFVPRALPAPREPVRRQ